jgi:hypothetical protein
LLHELTKSISVCPEAAAIAENITGRFRLFHERFGLPGLELKLPSPSASRATRRAAQTPAPLAQPERQGRPGKRPRQSSRVLRPHLLPVGIAHGTQRSRSPRELEQTP